MHGKIVARQRAREDRRGCGLHGGHQQDHRGGGAAVGHRQRFAAQPFHARVGVEHVSFVSMKFARPFEGVIRVQPHEGAAAVLGVGDVAVAGQN